MDFSKMEESSGVITASLEEAFAAARAYLRGTQWHKQLEKNPSAATATLLANGTGMLAVGVEALVQGLREPGPVIKNLVELAYKDFTSKKEKIRADQEELT